MNPDLIMSKRPQNIFYGDIFKICDKGCLFFGSGKTSAGRVASDYEIDNDNEVATDMACLTREGAELYGHFEMQFQAKSLPDPIGERIKIYFLLRMLDENETKQLYKKSQFEIKEIACSDFIDLSMFNITFAQKTNLMLDSMLPIEGINKNDYDPLDLFKKLVKGTDTRFLVVPWMDSHIEKGELIKNFISRQ